MSNFPLTEFLKTRPLNLKAVFAPSVSCSNVSDKDTGVTIQNIYCCSYFDLKRDLFKGYPAAVHLPLPLTQLKTQHNGANPLINLFFSTLGFMDIFITHADTTDRPAAD